MNLGAVEALLAACREELGPTRRLYFGTFPSEVRPEHVSQEALAVLKKYVDNDNLIIGGQSGSDVVLKHSKRCHDVEAIDERRVVLADGLDHRHFIGQNHGRWFENHLPFAKKA